MNTKNTNRDTRNNKSNAKAYQVPARKSDGTMTCLPQADTANRIPLDVGACVVCVLTEGTPDLQGHIPAVGTAVKHRFNPYYVNGGKKMPLEPGDVVFGKVVGVAEPTGGPAWKGFVEPICKLPGEVVQNPGFSCFVAASGLFPNFELLREDHGYDWTALQSAVHLGDAATLPEIAAAAVNRLASGTIGIKTIMKAITKVEKVEKVEPEVVEAEPVSEAEPASEGDQIGDQVGLHGDGIIVCATGDEGTSIAGAYVNGPTYKERQAAASVRPPKKGGKGDSRAARRHKVTGRGKGKTPADTGKDNTGKNKGGKKK